MVTSQRGMKRSFARLLRKNTHVDRRDVQSSRAGSTTIFENRSTLGQQFLRNKEKDPFLTKSNSTL